MEEDANHASSRHVVEVEHLSIRYPRGTRPALLDVSLAIAPGERMLLLGPTGSGKSTLALTLNGIVPQSINAEQRGYVRVAGMDTVDTPTGKLCTITAMVFQDPEAQFCMLRVDEEVAFGLESLNVPAENIGPRVTMALEQVGATHLASRRLDELSGGEKQRVALAAALAVEPAVLVLDEPTANLDPRATREFFRTLADLDALRKPALLIIEHKLEDLIGLVDRLVVLDRAGRLRASGAPREVMALEGRSLARDGVWLPQAIELALASGRLGAAFAPLTVSEAATDTMVHEWLLDRPQTITPQRPRTAPAPVALRATSVAFGYGRHAVIAPMDLTLTAGEAVALVGPNGSGKTTLLLGLSGLLKPLTGTLAFADVGMVFQNPEHQLVARTVEEELAYGLSERGLDRSEVARRVEAALQRFGLRELRDRNPYSLSGGQKRRLSVASMVVLEPAVLLVDEPTFGQDRTNAFALMDALSAAAAGGAAVVMATHDMRLAAEYADRVLVLDGGRVIADCSVEKLFRDDALLDRASLLRPPLVDWWLEHQQLDLRSVLRAARSSDHPGPASA